jgi:predicted RNA-binding protein YlxR (DUF448 family)
VDVQTVQQTVGVEPRMKGPTRTCVGCAKPDTAAALVRVVADLSAAPSAPIALAIDLAGGSFGRGAHVHPSRECLARAVRGGFARAFKAKVTVDAAAFAQQIVDAAYRRIAGLVVGARRAQQLAVGADSACEALAEGAPLVLVAMDAGSVARSNEIARAVSEGRALVLFDKTTFGALLGRDEVALASVKSDGLADEIKRIYFMADALRGQRVGGLEV